MKNYDLINNLTKNFKKNERDALSAGVHRLDFFYIILFKVNFVKKILKKLLYTCPARKSSILYFTILK